MSKYKVLENVHAADLETTLNHLASEWKPVLMSTTAASGNPMIIATVVLEEVTK